MTEHGITEGDEHRVDRPAAEALVQHVPPFSESFDPPPFVRRLVREIIGDPGESVDRLDRGADRRGIRIEATGKFS